MPYGIIRAKKAADFPPIFAPFQRNKALSLMRLVRALWNRFTRSINFYCIFMGVVIYWEREYGESVDFLAREGDYKLLVGRSNILGKVKGGGGG